MARNQLTVDVSTGESSISQYEPSADDLAREQVAADRKAAQEAKRIIREAALEDTPANVNSIPALRAEVNKIKAILRDSGGGF